MKALAKPANDRFQSAGEMRAALRAMSSATTFPPRPVTSVGLAAPVPPAKTPTTFRTATGEVGSINTIAETPAGVRGNRRRGVIVGGVAAVATIGIVVAVVTSGNKPATPVSSPPAPVAATTAPAKPAAPVPAAPREAPPPSRVLVRLASEPAGALITDAKRGVVIGATPFEQRLDRNASSLGVRLAKDGYAAVDLDIPLGGDFDKTVRLEPKKEKARSPGRASSSAPGSRKTTVAKAATPAASAPTAPPPVAPTAPAAPKPKADKW